MTSEKTKKRGAHLDAVTAPAREAQRQREKTYRERAMKLFPPVCFRCGREFSGKKLRDCDGPPRGSADHNYKSPDGSNWELLCIYCHENEHSRYLEQAAPAADTGGEPDSSSSGFRPFAGLEELRKKKAVSSEQ